MKKQMVSVLSIIMTIVMLAALPVYAVQTGDTAPTEGLYGHRDNGYTPQSVTLPKNNSGNTKIPSAFDGRDKFTYTAVKSQNDYGTCWAHAFIAAAETSLIKKGLADESVDLSELHLVTTAFGKTYDELNLLGDDEITIEEDYNALEIGGNHTMAAFATNRWVGITSENVMNYSEDAEYSIADEAVYSRDIYYGLDDAYLYGYYDINSKDAATIKALIMQYGIGITSYGHYSRYFNSSTGAYYNNTTGTNHEVTVIGWDDDYSRENFKAGIRPVNNGAWLVRNSYGESFGNDGYIWVSYEDASLDTEFAFADFVSSDTWDYNYQYDGGYSIAGFSTKNGAANIYTATGHQLLKAVNISFLNTTNESYTLKIYVNPSSEGRFVADDTPVYTGNYSTTYAGIYTAELSTPVELNKGDDFAVYICPAVENTAINYDVSTTGTWDWISYNEDISNAKSYTVSTSGISSKRNSYVYRIKAFTVDADLAAPTGLNAVSGDGTVTLTWDTVDGADEYEVYGGTDIGEYELLATVEENTARLVATDEKGLMLKYKVRAKNKNVTGRFCDGTTVRFANNGAEAEGITLDDITVSIYNKVGVQARAVFTPGGNNDIMVGYTIGDTGVAAVTPSGLIIPVSVGETTLTAVSRSGAKTATATVTVNSVHDCIGAAAIKENEVKGTCLVKGSHDELVYCSLCGELISKTRITDENFADHTKGEAVSKNVTRGDCKTQGGYDTVARCTVCNEIISSEHTDTGYGSHNFVNGVCTICALECSHICHQDGFNGILWKITKVFYRLFKINPVCECGVAHY